VEKASKHLPIDVIAEVDDGFGDFDTDNKEEDFTNFNDQTQPEIIDESGFGNFGVG